MNWLIQESLYTEDKQYNILLDCLKNAKQNIIILPNSFWDCIIDLKINNIDPKSIIPFGTTSFIAYGIKKGWNICWDKNYTYESLRCLGDDFINNDLELASLSNLKIPYDGKIFVRENAGFNVFKGQVISCYSWEDTVKGLKLSSNNEYRRDYDWHPIEDDTLFVCAPIKKIVKEYRVFVVNNKVITLSQYYFNKEIEYLNADDNIEVINYTNKIIEKLPYNMKTFVIDIFETEKGLKVGEINCLNCSGWYAIDLEKLIKSLL